MLYKRLQHSQRCMDSLIGEELVCTCTRQPENATERHAVSVTKNEEIVGHLLRNLPKVCLLLIRREAP